MSKFAEEQETPGFDTMFTSLEYVVNSYSSVSSALGQWALGTNHAGVHPLRSTIN